jgi:hypothetical protein
MDQSVLDALQRWPNVPAVYGWLSLSARGDWRLHPLGDAQGGGPGEGISNPQILSFMGRNYACESNGAWFFQNGPQRVYVRLDAAALIVHVRPEESALVTHHGKHIQQVSAWFADDTGQLYAQTDLGGVRIDDRDLLRLSEILQTDDGTSLLDTLETLNASGPVALCDPTGAYCALKQPAPCTFILQRDIAQRLGFIANPTAVTPSSQRP